MWCPDTDHKQEGEIIIPDVQENIENEQKQTKCDIHMKKEASDGSLAKYASNKKRGIKTEQKLKETEDIEQKDGHSEDTKEESDHYNEDDGETCVMKTEDYVGTEVTTQSVLYGRDQQQKKKINKMDYIETEDTRTEYAKEKMVCKDQERAENDNDEESESLENEDDLLAKLVCSTEDETDLPKPFEIEKLRVKETCLENIKNEGIQTPERQEGIFSKNVVEMPETKGTNEQDKQGHEQHKWQDNCELADVFGKKEGREKRLETVETLPRLSKQTLEENVTFNELGPKTTTEVNEGVNETFDASEDTMQSDSLEFIRTLNASLNDMLVEATEIEQDLKTPISSMKLGTKQIQTLKEMAKFTLKEYAELRTKLLVETTKREMDSEEKAEDFMTANQADDEIFELNIEKECTTVDTIRESLKKGKRDSSVEINGKDLNAEHTPDVTEEKTEFIMDLQDKSESMKAEVRLLGEADALMTVESLDEMMNQILKETIEMENKFIQEIEPSSETSCNVEFQRPTSSALLLEDERGLLGDTVESLVEMVEAGIYEAVNKQKDQHNVSSPECEPTDADRDFKQLEKNTVGETLFRSNDGMSEINRPGLKRRFDDMSKDLPKVKDHKSPLVEWSTTADLNVQQSSLDFSVQKSRIAVKNPLVRPPKDPRKLLNKTSMEPSLPKPPPCGLLRGRHGVAVSVQSQGVIGFKLPGMVAELPTLRKTEFGRKVREEEKAESTQQKEVSTD
ncbi:putative early endosome antigen 1-like [Triplophysa rosa]|uniref:Early endosome antigen 1-like n=1 Tax=Triplophysa rosa TaxID=992332 RepID=A0A9W7TIA4_TRIRA|nr:putative early endosome antigen 1-like [Triplophysa rosa]